MKRSPMPPRTKRMPRRAGWIPRTTRVRARNPKRQASEFVRAYHSKKRKRWIAAHRCLVCKALPSVNAHTRHPSSGAGYKGDYCAIAPICRAHECEKHQHGEDTFNVKYAQQLDGHTLAAHAARIEAEWQCLEAMA
jgi:hypothetical protein